MKYFIDNEKNEFDKIEFDNILYDACRCETLDNQMKIIPAYLPFNKEEFFHSGVIFKAIELYYQDNIKKLKENKECYVDEVRFFTKEDDE